MTTVTLYSAFPRAIDNSMREEFVTCPQRFYRSYINRLTLSVPSVHLHAGKAFAAGLERTRRAFYDKGRCSDGALAEGCAALVEAYGDFDDQLPEDHPKSCDRLLDALLYYFRVFPLWEDPFRPAMLPGSNRHAIEFNFTIPLDIEHPDTGEPLVYCGRFDQVVERDGLLFIEDDKTASKLGETWRKQWDLSSQITGYVWGAREGGFPVAGALIRGVGLMKTKTSHDQAITYRADWEIERWHGQLLSDIRRMVQCYQTGRWDHALSKACSSFGGCAFSSLCKSPEPERWIDGFYVNNDWSPLPVSMYPEEVV